MTSLSKDRVRAAWRAVGIALVVAVIYLSLARLAQPPAIEGGDKIGHLLAYGALMFWHASLVSTITAARERLTLA